MKKIYTSIDIGSDSIKFIVGEYLNGKINVLASLSKKSKGIKKGLIIEASSVVTTIKEMVKEIDDNLGITIKKVIVNIMSYNAKFLFVTSTKKITNDDNLITSTDVNDLIKKSVYGKLDKNYELLTIIPLDFIIDEKGKNNYPIGLKGTKVEFKGVMISVPKKNMYSVISVLESANLEVFDVTFNGIADYFEIKNDILNKQIGAIINVGHDVTTISIINKGKFMNTEVLQMGGSSIEKDLEYFFKINNNDARVLKEKFASSHKRFSQLSETFEITTLNKETLKLNQLEVSEIVMARINEILEFSKKQIQLLTKQSINYIVLTGGLTEIKSFKHLAFEIFGKDVIIYSVDTLGVRHNKYITSLGMIKYLIDKLKIRGREYSMITGEDENLLITPKNKFKSEKKVITKLFTNFLGSNSKEDK